MLVVEQNAKVALASTQYGYVLEVGRVALHGPSDELEGTRASAPLPRLLMANFLQHVVAGLANGGIYATLALALVLDPPGDGVLNFAQGEMGMFATYIAWSLIYSAGITYWLGFGLTLVIAFVGGVLVHQVVIRPFALRPELTVVIVTVALLVILNGAAGWIWSPQEKFFASPFPLRVLTSAAS